MDPADLARWTRFAMKGGIGKCVAICDCVAETPDDLMFLKDDEIVVLLQVQDSDGVYLGYCEGVIGKFNAKNVQFTTKLKKPVMAKRSSVASTHSSTGKSPTPPGSSSGFKSPTPTWGTNTPSATPPPVPRTDSRASSFMHGRRVSSSSVLPPSPGVGLGFNIPPPAPKPEYAHVREESVSSLHPSSASTSSRWEHDSKSSQEDIAQHFGHAHARDESVSSLHPSTTSTSSRWDRDSKSTHEREALAFNVVGPEPTSPPHSPPATTSAHDTPDTITQSISISSNLSTSSAVSTPSTLLTPSPPALHPTNPKLALADNTAWNRASMTLERQIDLMHELSMEEVRKPSPLHLGVTAEVEEEDDGLLTSPLRIEKKATSPLTQTTYDEPPPSTSATVDSSFSTDSFAQQQRLSTASSGSDGEVGIGLSLLQDLVNGMDDSDSGSEYDSDDGKRVSMSSEGGTVEGLRYGDDEDGEGVLEFPMPPRTVSMASSAATTSPRMQAFPRTTTPQQQQSPTSPSFSVSRFRGMSTTSTTSSAVGSQRQRVPSLAPSHASTGTVGTQSSWEGAGDIYDNYRYSRMSMASSAWRGSVGGASGVGVPPMPAVGEGVSTGKRKEEEDGNESEGSVYTQGSGSRRGSMASVANATTATPSSPPQADTKVPHRPAPLTLANDETSPLLHATWGSPLSSPSPTRAGMMSAMPAMGMVQVSQGGVITNAGSGSGGMASAMRQRIEEEKLTSPTSPTFGGLETAKPVDDSIVSGLGDKIVVEDEEELPSRILTASPDPDMTVEEDADRTVDGPEIILPSTPVSAAAPPLPPTIDIDDSNVSGPTDGSASPRPSHLRPSLRDLREGGTVTIPGTGERRSLFLPHPNAPKAPLTSPGPMYVQQAQPPPPMQHFPPGAPHPIYGAPPPGAQPYGAPGAPLPPGAGYPPRPRPNAFHINVVRQALSMRPPPGPPPIPIGGKMPAAPRGPTIYGRLEVDMASSVGPVPVFWSVEPPPTKVAKRAPTLGATPPPPPPQQPGHPNHAPQVPSGLSQSPPPGAMGVGKRPSVASLRDGLGMERVGSPSGRGLERVGSPSSGLAAPPIVPPSPTASITSTASGPPILGAANAAARLSARSSSASASGVGLGGASVGLGGGDAVGVVDENAQRRNSGGTAGGEGEVGKPIPRANFFPKAGGVRPRSRSFSDLKSVAAVGKSSLRSSLTGGGVKKSSSLVASGSELAAPSNKLVKTTPLRPSPLSLSQNIVTNRTLKPQVSTPILKSPTSPLAQSMIVGNTRSESPAARESVPPSPAPPLSPNRSMGFGHSASLNGLGGGRRGSEGGVSGAGSRMSEPGAGDVDGEGKKVGVGLPSRPIPISRSTLPPGASPSMLDVSSSAGSGGAGTSTSPSSSSSMMQSRWMDEKDGEGTGDASSRAVPPLSLSNLNANVNGATGGTGTPTSAVSTTGGAVGVGRQNSLRAKLSLPNLRRKMSRQDEGNGVPPLSPVDGAHQDVLLQVQDMEFELVRPNFANYSAAARSSEDSAVLGPSMAISAPLDSSVGSGGGPRPSSSLSPSSSAPGGSYLRPESPAVSINSFVSGRSPTVDASHTSWIPAGSSTLSASPYTAPKTLPESESQMEAHRNRELKWMSVLSSSPPSQARKSKKTRKLLLEGVPSSVRYLVWSHLTDGKARCVQGVYAQLCKRGRVPVTADVERDVEQGEWFGMEEQAQLRVLSDAGGGVVQLLQAYLNMVPDIQYTSGLSHIVGQLLLLAPEEDAFWIFISIMDSFIRPYFSTGSTQMEVDAALFAKALEVNDPGLARKLLVDMGIAPSLICAPWFTSLFVGCLPSEYLTRTWDLFLYDGIPFLIRVGLAIVSFVRRQLLESTSEEAVLALLHRPPIVSLPPTPENYLSFVFSIKLKDDDVRKQRIKMEAQVKRQTQQQLGMQGKSGAGSISLPRV